MARAMKDSGIPWIGKIPENWNYGKCKSILCVNDGGVWGNDPLEDGSDKIVIRSTEQTIDGNWCIDNPAKRDLSNVDYTNSLIVEGDLLITKSSGSDLHIGKTTIADSYFSKNECYFSNFIQRIRCKDTYIPRLLWYIFNSSLVREQCVFLQNSTSGIGNINASIIDNLYIPIPERTEQKRIIAYLDTECARIDAVMEQTRASIEEYKKLKQSVITQAVTKGIRPNRPMKDSGIDWIGQIPAEWEVYRIANLYDERNESGQEDLPILSVSINTGISDHEVADEEQTRVFVRSEDKTKYKRVYPGDLAYNMMRAWQGAFGAVRVDGMVSPAYVVVKPKQGIKLDSRFMEALLRTPAAIEEMHRYSRGITDFRLRLYWPEFKNIRVCIPSETEQNEIADFIDEKSIEFDTLIAKKEHFLSEMESYKKSLIFEYVTGKKEVV